MLIRCVKRLPNTFFVPHCSFAEKSRTGITSLLGILHCKSPQPLTHLGRTTQATYSTINMSDENLSKQIDEIEALAAIYNEEWKTEDEVHRTYSISITEGGKAATLLVTLPPEYPSQSPPFYLLTAPWMNGADLNELYSELEQIYMDYMGESIIHMWIERVREYLQHRCVDEENLDSAVTIEEERDKEEKHLVKFPDVEVEPDEVCPSIITAEPFTDRKSKFQGHVASVTSVAQVKLVLAELYKNRKIAQATHNMYAYRIYNESTKMWLQDCEDDGETHAGGRMMHLLQILNVKNVLVVVSRWFGGILLGGDRFKHINNAARDVLELGGFLDPAKNCPASPAPTLDAKKKSKKSK